MTFRELQALILLYQAAPEAARAAARRILPDLAEVANLQVAPPPAPARRRRLVAWRLEDGKIAGPPLCQETVICAESDVEEHKAAFAARFPYANVQIEVRESR